jgi:hypothetical protein
MKTFPAKQALPLERFRAKWAPVRVKKTRQSKESKPGSDSIRTDQALGCDLQQKMSQGNNARAI